MDADFTLRPAVPEDAQAIAELFQIAAAGLADYFWGNFQDEFPELTPLEIGATGFAEANDEYSYTNCLMAEIGGTVAGMSMTFPMKATPKPLPDDYDPVMRPFMELEEDGSFYVCAVGVYGQYRGQGIGTALMERAEQRAREEGCGAMSLLVFDANDGAKRLYERLGYRVADRRAVVPHPLIQAEGDVLLMVRPFDETHMNESSKE